MVGGCSGAWRITRVVDGDGGEGGCENGVLWVLVESSEKNAANLSSINLVNPYAL